MANPIGRENLRIITGKIDRNNNGSIDANEAKVSGSVGNHNGVNGVAETATAIDQGKATLSRLTPTAADAVAEEFANGDAWVSKEDLFISDSARDRIDTNADGRVSKKELSAGLQRSDIAITGDGIKLSSEASGYYRPTPPSVNPSNGNRPTPPSVNPSNSGRPTPPSVNPSNGDRPTPPSVDPSNHTPRYYYQPEFPVILQSNPQELPTIQQKPAPAPARKVDMSEVSTDVVGLLAEKGRLRGLKKTLGITSHPELTAQQAKEALASGKTIYLADDGGTHLSKDAYKPVTSQSQLDPLLSGMREQKLGALQANENRAYDQRVSAWVQDDVDTREMHLPEFNSIFNMERLNLSNYLITQGGRSFNRNIITAMNVYRQSDVRQEIATRWHNEPDMDTHDFNRMAAQVISDHVASLANTANFQSEWSIQQSPIPGLRYPDTQDDLDYNTEIIRQTAMELPMLLQSAVQN